MSEMRPEVPIYSGEATTTTIIFVGVSNSAIRDPRTPPECGVMSYTVSSENTVPSRPLSENAVRIGNSLLDARVPESAILRDTSEDF
jgi:hypothetical protein